MSDFLEVLKSHRRAFLGAFIFLVVTNIFGLALPWGIKLILDEVLSQGRRDLLPWIAAGLLVLIFLRALTHYYGTMLGMRAAENAVSCLREKLYAHVLRLSVLTVENFTTGGLLSRLVSDLESVKKFLLSGFLDFLYSILSAVLIAGVLWFMDWTLALVALFFLPIFALVYWKQVGKLKQKYGDLRQGYTELSAYLGEVFRGIRAVQAFSRREYELSRFGQKQGNILGVASGTYAADAGFWSLAELLSSAGLVVLLWIGAGRVMEGRMTVGTLMAFYTYSGLLFFPLLRIAAVNGAYQEARASLVRIYDLLQKRPDPPEAPGAVKLNEIKGAVEFQGVHFSYDGSRKVIEEMNFKINPGEVVVLAGPSGSGKTTMISLLARFFDPQSGRILIDGYDLRQLDLNAYRARIAMVLQNDFLFDDSIYRNILYGNLDAGPEAVYQAARVANIHDLILSFPSQYETPVGEGGIHLSGGERQRVAIARAVLRDPAILILDEATSNVDVDSERLITEALQKLMIGRTTFIISHRASAADVAHKTLFVESGKILTHGAS